MITEEKLIRKGTRKGGHLDWFVRAVLAGLTYLILLVAMLLFGKIVKDGGPTLITDKARQSVLGLVKSAVADGAALVCGGKAVAGAGYFMEPTILRIHAEPIVGAGVRGQS